MKCFTFPPFVIPFVIVVVGLGVATAVAQDQPATLQQRAVKTESTEGDSHKIAEARQARGVIEAYVAAALAGRVDEAKTLTLSIPFGKTDASTRKNIERLREFVEIDSLAIDRVVVSQKKHPGFGMRMGIAVSAPVKFSKPPVTGLHDGRVAFSLFLFHGKWCVVDIEYLSQNAAEERLDHFKRNNVTEEISSHRDRRKNARSSDPFEAETTPPKSVEPPTRPSILPTRRLFQGGQIILAFSDKNDVVWGCSKTTGKWVKQPIEPVPSAEHEILPTLGQTVAGFMVKKTAYAFSSVAERWDRVSVELSKEATRMEQIIAVAFNIVAVKGKTGIYAFSSQFGRWKKLPLSADATRHWWAGPDMVFVMTKNGPYTFANSTGRWTSPADSTTASSTMESGLVSGSTSGRGGIDFGRSSFDITNETANESLRIAQQLRRLKQSKVTSPEVTTLEKQLRESVTQDFVQRQQRQRTELANLMKRLERIQHLIESRENNKDQIIDRRIEELLNPALRWDTKSTAGVLVPHRSDIEKAAGPQSVEGTNQAGAGRRRLSGDTDDAAAGSDSAKESLRNILRDRWKATEAEYKVGKRTLADVMRAALQYQKHVIDTAKGEQEKQDARRAYIAMLRDLRKVLETMYRAGKVPQSEVLETDAALLKAEAQ